jgi:hypothetical protein
MNNIKINFESPFTKCPYNLRIHSLEASAIINIGSWFCTSCCYFVDREVYDSDLSKSYVICKYITLKDRLTLAKELIK